MINNLSPIILFVYNRPHHLIKTLDALSANELAKESDLICFCDGPKENADERQKEKINTVRAIIDKENRFKSVEVVKRDRNYGLSTSIITGVSEIFKKYEKAIILEDDLITSKYFLQYMNEALVKYGNENNVLSICSCNYFANSEKIPETFFTPYTDCLGWATWRTRWDTFNSDTLFLYRKIKENNFISKFNVYGGYNHYALMRLKLLGKSNSWAINWLAVSILNNKLNLYPRFSLCDHIGFGEDSTNSSTANYSKRMLFADKPINIYDIRIEENKVAINEMRRNMKKQHILNNIKLTITSWLNRFRLIL